MKTFLFYTATVLLWLAITGASLLWLVEGMRYDEHRPCQTTLSP